ncbi:MAG: FkbM family methyltransferase [Flavobacterium sp.]|uniref:FkbM family methyltransferase n=1 Tax=Flavobacterium sp. TaxID=239 RepID=UPI00391B5178
MNIRTKIIQKLVHINEGIFFYPKLRRFYIKNLQKGNVNILDVGANKGQSIDFFRKIYPNASIDSFEPNKKLFAFLLNKYKTNSEQIRIFNLGVSNTIDELVFMRIF